MMSNKKLKKINLFSERFYNSCFFFLKEMS